MLQGEEPAHSVLAVEVESQQVEIGYQLLEMVGSQQVEIEYQLLELEVLSRVVVLEDD